MKSIFTKQKLALMIAAVFLAPSVATALDLYSYTFDDDLPGPGRPANFDFDFSGSGAPDGSFPLSQQVTTNDGVAGSQSYKVGMDASTVTTYFYGGIGDYAVDASEMTPLAGGAAGSNSPSRYRFSLDAKVTGAISATPFELSVQAIDKDYEVTHDVDANGDGDKLDGAATYIAAGLFPTLVNGADYVHLSYTLNQGTIGKDNGVPAPDFNNGLALQWTLTFNSGGFGLTANNSISLDNIKFEFLDAVPGDYNGNGVVDAADYVMWRDNVGASTLPNRGAGITGNVGAADYNFWRSHFGSTSGSGSALGASSAVPEPGSLMLIVAGATAVFAGYTAKRRNRS